MTINSYFAQNQGLDRGIFALEQERLDKNVENTLTDTRFCLTNVTG